MVENKLPKTKDKWYELTSVKALILAGITSTMLILILILKPTGYDSIISQIFIILLSATASASFSYWIAADSYTKRSDRRLKTYASSAIRHLSVVFEDTHKICERIRGIMQNLENFNKIIDKRNVIETLENISAMISSLETHIKLGESNWQGIFEEEIVLTEPESQDMARYDSESTEGLMRTQKLESLGILAGGIAHDFNNILTGILGNVSLAKVLIGTDERVLSKLTGAEKACLQAKKLVQQLLIFSKGGFPIKKTTSITKLLQEWANFALSGSNVGCEFSISDDLWAVEIDEGQINQVINNLVINSIQAMPRGGVIRIYAENTNIRAIDKIPLKDGKYIKISVIDHGIGIPEELLQRIFDPFFTTKPKGSGLGLSIAHSIIHKHGGYIAVESQVGYGATFHVYLPASFDKIQVIEEKTFGEGEKLIKERVRILVMDDEETIRQLVYEMLNNMGYEVITAENGNEAINLYIKAQESGQPFDAVMLDLTIPGAMGGRETIQRLLEIDPNVVAIVSSGYSNDPVMDNFREYGFKGAIPKPYTTKDFINVLNEAIAEKTKLI